jgi:hypothetical protein
MTPPNAWQKRRHASGWSGGYVEWIENGTAYLSVVFSWDLGHAYQRAVWHRAAGRTVKAGGPAIDLQPAYLADVADCSGHVPAIQRHNPRACFTTRGCIRRCPFCAVPKTEGSFRELDDFELRPIVCDNNFLASSREHFDAVIDGLGAFTDVDFNQGLDARLLTRYHAGRLAELDFKWLRLAWDQVETEAQFRRAWQTLRDAGIPARKIGVYVLIGFEDTPEDALYRLDTIWNKLHSWPFPMRYQPLDAEQRNAYIADNWTHQELKRYTRYWSNLRHLSAIPFDEYDPDRRS